MPVSNQKTTTSSRPGFSGPGSTPSTAATKEPRKPAARPRVGRKSDPGPARIKPPSIAAEQQEPQPPETTLEFVAIIARLTKALESRDEELRLRSEQAQELQFKVMDLERQLKEMGRREGELRVSMERREAELRLSMEMVEAALMDDMQRQVSEASDERQKDQATIKSLTRKIEYLQESKSGETEEQMLAALDFNDYPLVPSSESTTEPRRGSWPELSHQAFYKQTSGGTPGSALDGHKRSMERMRQAYEQQLTDLSDRLSECHAQLVASQAAAQPYPFPAPHLMSPYYPPLMAPNGDYYAGAAAHLGGVEKIQRAERSHPRRSSAPARRGWQPSHSQYH